MLSTNISGIPELIKSGENGILVEQNDTGALILALSSLISQPEYRKNLGQAGSSKVRSLLDKDTNIQQLYEQFL